jgi:outer membrane protein OmpA-like peptidoglycan-associated protein
LCDGTASGGCARVQTTPQADEVSRYTMRFALSGTLLPFLEAHLGASAAVTSDDQSKPRLVQVVGNPTLGLKAFLPAKPDRLFRVGGQAELWLPSSSGETGIEGSATSFALRALGTLDLSESSDRARAVPLRAHVNLGYVFDNSGALVAASEAANQRKIGRIRRFELGINRLDRFELALAIEGAFRSVRPFLEWSLDVPVARQSYLCTASSLEPGDSCLKSADFSALPARLGVGARWLTPLAGLGLTGALELGTGATSHFLQELAPETPWNLYFGLGYALDTVPAPPVIQQVKVESVRVVQAKPVQQLFILGKVVDRKTLAPIEGAVVRFERAELTALVTGPDGTFKTGSLEPGAYAFHISADEHEEGQCQGVLPPRAAEEPSAARAPLTLELDCPLEPSPRLANVPGVLFDAESGGVIAAAKVKIEDHAGRSLELNANNAGAFRFQNVPFGRVRISVEAPGYLLSVTELELKSAALEALRLGLNPKPKRPNVTVSPKELVLAKAVRFEPGSLELLPGSEALLEEVADVLRSRSELLLIEIRGYIDDTGALSDAILLSQKRADVVRLALIRLGVEGARLSAQGAGEEEQKPSVSVAEQNKNRRVRFVITMTNKKR